MVIGAGQQYPAALRRLALLGQAHIKAAGSAEPFSHAGGKHLVNVLHQHDGRREITRQPLEQGFQRCRPTGG
ncbi:hypothetical protein D3C87_1784180 [compost metagenome]